MSGPEIAEVLSMPRSTVSAILARIGLGKLSALERPEPPNRYERRRPGGLLHIDVKKLAGIDRAGHRVTGSRRGQAAGAGWEYVYVCIDDATRLAYVEVLTDERAITAVGFLRRAVAHFASYGIRVERVMTDNGPAYRSAVHALACRALRIRHLRPRSNGKAERLIRTMLAGWAYGAIYGSSEERQRALPGWLAFYNRQRPHGSLGRQAPIERLLTLMNNVPGTYS
jgi:transposase InsO family protein